MTSPAHLDPRVVDALLVDSEPYLSCDDCFDMVDGALTGLLESDGALDEPFRTHLAACKVCHEEAVSLIELAAADHGLTAQAATARLEHVVRAG